MRLKAVVPGAGDAIAEFRRGKFYRPDGMPKHHKPRAPLSMFYSLWRQHTICKVRGHWPMKPEKPHHIPVCEICHFMVFESDGLATGATYPQAPECGGCWRERYQEEHGLIVKARR